MLDLGHVTCVVGYSLPGRNRTRHVQYHPTYYMHDLIRSIYAYIDVHNFHVFRA